MEEEGPDAVEMAAQAHEEGKAQAQGQVGGGMADPFSPPLDDSPFARELEETRLLKEESVRLLLALQARYPETYIKKLETL